nr:hypothetical protein [Tanacetum cinerariifolium]
MVAYTQRFNELALMCPRMVKLKSVKIDAYIQGLSNNNEGTVTSSKPTNLNEVVCTAHKLMEQKLQARSERIIEGNKRKWESFQSWNSSGKSNHKDNSRQSSQNNQKQRNARAMTTASNEGNLHKARYCKEKNIATGANAQPIWTCYDCGKQGYMRNQCPKNLNQEEVKEARGRAYAIKDTEPQGPNMVTGTFLFNNQYASILFYSGSDRSFVDTKFSFMLDIDPVKIDASYEVKLADGRIVSTNIVLKGCTLDLVNHLFKINLITIELGNKTLTVEGDKDVDVDNFKRCFTSYTFAVEYTPKEFEVVKLARESKGLDVIYNSHYCAIPRQSQKSNGSFGSQDLCVRQELLEYRNVNFEGEVVYTTSLSMVCEVFFISKAEYVALSASCAKVMWMRTQLKDYGYNYNKIPLYYDSQSAIAISCNPVQHYHGDRLDGCVGLKCDKRNTGLVGFVGNNVTMLFAVDENDVIEAVKVVVYCSGRV